MALQYHGVDGSYILANMERLANDGWCVVLKKLPPGFPWIISLLKRAIKGTYVAVASFHLERYVDEQTFRFNNRDVGDGLRFQRVLRNVVGKRLTYRMLTAAGDAGFMGIK